MNIILFGPPGVGKSTIIGYLKTMGYKALDLEDVYPHNIRHELPKLLDNVVFGGADLDPQLDYGSNVRKYLLITKTQQEYEMRRQTRDKKIPGKGSQSKHLLSDWLDNNWDGVWQLRSDLGPKECAHRIASHLGSKYSFKKG